LSSVGLPAFRECEDAQIPNCTEAQHQMNRRTEFKIVSGTTTNQQIKPNTSNNATVINPTLIDANGYYTVQEGDTVYSIMRATGVPVATIIRLNNLTNPDSIKAGQKLKMR
jgi:LysM repeat protein